MSLLTMLALFLAFDAIIAAIRSCAPESESARRERTRVVIPLPPKFGPPYDAAKLAQSLHDEADYEYTKAEAWALAIAIVAGLTAVVMLILHYIH
jgi:hypothetical protein